MAKAKRPLTQQDAFDLSPAVREAAWGLKGHLLRNGPPDEAGRPMTAPDVNADADVRARFAVTDEDVEASGAAYFNGQWDDLPPRSKAIYRDAIRRALTVYAKRQSALAKLHPTHQEKGR